MTSLNLTRKNFSDCALKISQCMLMVSVVFIFFSRRLYALTVICAFCLWTIALILNRFTPAKINALFYLFVGFYLLQVAGWLLTENATQGMAELETSLAMLAFPIVLWLTPPIEKKFYEIGVVLIIITALFGSLIIHSLVIWEIIITGKPLTALIFAEEYHYVFLSGRVHIHPSYFSILIIISVFIIFYRYLPEASRIGKIMLVMAGAYLIFFLFLLMSRGPWLAFLSILFISSIRFYKRKHLFSSLLLISMMIITCLFMFDPLFKRFINPILNYEETKTIHSMSIDYHLKSWQCSIESGNSLLSFVFGQGVGDEKDYLVSCYSKNNLTEMVAERFNAHNDYLSQFVKNGIVGLLFLVSIIGYTLYQSMVQKNVAAFFVTGLLAVAFFFESYLNVSQGVFFFSYFIPFFTNQVISDEQYEFRI